MRKNFISSWIDRYRQNKINKKIISSIKSNPTPIEYQRQLDYMHKFHTIKYMYNNAKEICFMYKDFSMVDTLRMKGKPNCLECNKSPINHGCYYNKYLVCTLINSKPTIHTDNLKEDLDALKEDYSDLFLDDNDYYTQWI